jgi:hypothetical protein
MAQDNGVFFPDNDFLASAGAMNTFTVIQKDGKRGLKCDTRDNAWGAGLDLKYGGFQFAAGDKITISGKVISGDNWNLDIGWLIDDTYRLPKSLKKLVGEFTENFTLDAEDVITISKCDPPAIRINNKAVNTEIEIYTLVVERLP